MRRSVRFEWRVEDVVAWTEVAVAVIAVILLLTGAR